MMPCFSWRQGEKAGDPFVENRSLTAHPSHEGILFTMRSSMVDKHGKMFNNNQSHIFMEMDQIISLANFLLIYLKEMNEAKNKNVLP